MLNNLNLYESNSPQEWDILLNPSNYHYHHGYIGKRKNIFENPIYDYILPFIDNGSTVLDCGCGWGSPANIVHIEKQCEVTCITNSADQIKFINNYHKHLNVFKKDLNNFSPHKKYDTGIFIESFSHIEDKNTDILLKNLSEKVNNLLFMVQLSRKDPFYCKEWEMYFNTLENLIKKLNRQGFQTIFCKDLKSDYLVPSYTYWASRLNIIKPVSGQLLELQKLAKETLEYTDMRAESIGLFIIYACNLNR